MFLKTAVCHGHPSTRRRPEQLAVVAQLLRREQVLWLSPLQAAGRAIVPASRTSLGVVSAATSSMCMYLCTISTGWGLCKAVAACQLADSWLPGQDLGKVSVQGAQGVAQLAPVYRSSGHCVGAWVEIGAGGRNKLQWHDRKQICAQSTRSRQVQEAPGSLIHQGCTAGLPSGAPPQSGTLQGKAFHATIALPRAQLLPSGLHT